MYVLTTVIIAIGAALPMTTEAGKQAAVDQQVSQMENFGMQVSDAQYAAMAKGTAYLPYTTGGAVLIFTLVIALIMAAILWAIFNAALGGDATYKQILTVLVHGSVISAVGQLFTGPLNYFRGAVTSATNLSVLLPMLDEKSFIGKLAGAIDLFIIWWLVVLAIGLAVLYRRKTQPIAFTLFGIYAVIALCIAAFMSR
jgi:Yip1 domain